ncbi:MAG: TIM barrel protein [Candidatus Latescibacteria bacterium]|nr:TIM barrel protein [Candidatus Latescibacterota bacterium]
MKNDQTIGSTTRPLNQLSFAQACEHIAAAGYTDVAVFAHQQAMPIDSASTADQVAQTRQEAADAGLNPSMLLGRTQLDLGLDQATDDYRRLIDNAAGLGAQWILELGTGKEAHYEDYPKLMAAVAPHAAEAGVGISLKPHGGISLTATELIALHDQVDHPAFRISYDPGNIIHYTKGEVRPESEADLIASRTSTLIIKDCDLVDGQPNVMVTAGDGLVDFPVVLGKLTAGGFAGPMYVECVGSTEPEAVARDLAFTRGLVTGILSTR